MQSQHGKRTARAEPCQLREITGQTALFFFYNFAPADSRFLAVELAARHTLRLVLPGPHMLALQYFFYYWR